MQVLLSASGTRGDIEPALGLALRLQELGAQVRVCAPPNFERRLTELGVPLVPLGPPIPRLDQPHCPPLWTWHGRLPPERVRA